MLMCAGGVLDVQDAAVKQTRMGMPHTLVKWAAWAEGKPLPFHPHNHSSPYPMTTRPSCSTESVNPQTGPSPRPLTHVWFLLHPPGDNPDFGSARELQRTGLAPLDLEAVLEALAAVLGATRGAGKAEAQPVVRVADARWPVLCSKVRTTESVV